MEEPENICEDCGKPLFGRIDKKFCNDSCRNAHFNKVNRVSNNYVRQINRILKKNRDILASLNAEETAKTKGKVLSRLGFSFDYYTNIYTTKTGKTYYFCYDQGYLPLDADNYALVIKKEYV